MGLKNEQYVFIKLIPANNCTINPKVEFNFKVKKKLKVVNILTVLIS